jgi:hypothetical protein
MAIAYDLITDGSRKAKAENDKFVAGLVSQARAAREATVAGADLLKLQADLALQAAQNDKGTGGFMRALIPRPTRYERIRPSETVEVGSLTQQPPTTKRPTMI